MPRYQLQCPECSLEISVNTSQAGETLTCTCGKSVDVPTMRELRELPQVEDEGQVAGESGWSIQRGLLFVFGLVALSLALISGFNLLSERSQLGTEKPSFAELEMDMATLTPVEAWNAWIFLRERKLTERVEPEYLVNRERVQVLDRYLISVAVLGALGLVSLAASLIKRN